MTKPFLPNSLAAQGRSLPPKRPAANPVPLTGSPTHPLTAPPTRRSNWLGPRYEPPNLSASATVSDIQTAIRSAEFGDTTQLFRLYRDCLMGDDHIQGELAKRKLAVIGQPMAILPADKESEDDQRAAAACLRARDDCENWSLALGSLMNACLWPVRLAENIFKPADARAVSYEMESDEPADHVSGKVGEPVSGSKPVTRRDFQLLYTLKRIEDVNPMLFCFRHAYLGGGTAMGTATPAQSLPLTGSPTHPLTTPPLPLAGSPTLSPANPYALDLDSWEPLLRLWPIDDQGRIIYDASRATPLDPTRHLVHRGHLLTDQKDNWGGPMRAILILWLMRALGREWFGRFMERYGMPFPVGKTNAEDPQAVDLLKTAFSLATKIGGLVIGQDDAVELAAANVQGGAEGHKTWVTLCNDAITFALTGLKASDSPAGLNAGQDKQIATVREDMRVLDQKLLGEVLVKQLFRRFLDYNGLPGNVTIAWGGLSEADALLFSQLLKTLSEAGFEPTDEAVPGMQEKVGFELQRKAPPPSLSASASASASPDDPQTLSVKRHGQLVYFSAGGNPTHRPTHSPAHPTNAIADQRRASLARAYRGAMAPFREIILASDNREACLKQLTAAYADWDPARLATELDEALQLCAAAGAAAAVAADVSRR